jgi:hypothetical protein
MRIPSLLLLSLLLAALLAAPLTAIEPAQPASLPAQLQTADVSAPLPTTQQSLVPEQKDNLAAEDDGICYKIRAYIFKRDDDHAPELTGSTTCGPSQPHAKSVTAPKARLVPAD